MRNLWIFISKYNAFFFFVIFFVFSLILVVRNNSFQRASILNSSSQWIGQTYEKVNNFKSYITLGQTNDSLVAENARLRNQLKISLFDDNIVKKSVNDTVTHQQYSYIVARVINNSIHQKNNYITINRGSDQGIRKGMGVIGSSGVVGIVLNVSKNFATIQSLLHNETKISASLATSNAFGSLVWGEGNYDPKFAILQDIPNHIKVKKGENVVTSGYSLFPAGIMIGKVNRTDLKGGNNFLNVEVKLSSDFSTLAYVYVIDNLYSTEQNKLEADSLKDE